MPYPIYIINISSTCKKLKWKRIFHVKFMLGDAPKNLERNGPINGGLRGTMGHSKLGKCCALKLEHGWALNGRQRETERVREAEREGGNVALRIRLVDASSTWNMLGKRIASPGITRIFTKNWRVTEGGGVRRGKPCEREGGAFNVPTMQLINCSNPLLAAFQKA